MQGVFFRGLSEEIKDLLAARDETSSLEELISLAIRLDNRLAERRRERVARRSVPPPPLYSNQPRQPAPAPPLLPEQAPAVMAPAAPVLNPEEPMQLGQMKLSPEERQRRLRLGLCIYCGLAGHILAHCPTRPKEQAHQPAEGHW